MYKGSDESNSLTHWKYIKRTGTKGNYRYYYKDTKLDKLRDERAKLYNEYKSSKDYANSLTKFVSYYTQQLDEKNNGDVLATDANKNLQGWKKQRDDAIEKHMENAKKYNRIDKAYKEKAEKHVNSIGYKAVNLLNEVDDAIETGKRKVKKLISRLK